MVATTTSDSRGKPATVRLRTERFDAECTARGATTETDKARLVGSDRGTLHRIRTGYITNPSSELVIRWAQRLGVAVEDLWENVNV